MPRRVWYVLAAVAAAAAAAALYVFIAPDRYVATAELAVSPIAMDNLYRGLPVLRAAGRDDDRPVRTVARLAESGAVADRVIRRLRLDSRDDALDALDVEVDEDANVVALHGDASRPDRAAQIANAFADEVVSQRHLGFQSAVVTALERTREQLSQVPASRRNEPEFLPLSRRVTELRTLEGTGDPTISLASAAVAPERSERPSAALIPAAAGTALLLGLLALAALRRPAPARTQGPQAVQPVADRALAERLERAVARLERAKPAPATAPAAAAVPDEREAMLERRIDAVTRRERELAKRTAEFAQRERELASAAESFDEREAAVRQREQEAEERAESLARTEREQPRPTPAEPTRAAGAYNIGELERLVEANAEAQPERVEEWNGYLFHLRQYAGADGRLPASFDYLVDETFGELLRES